jgi:hypothetical protein
MTKLIILTVALAIGSARSRRADVTLKQTTGGKGLGLSGSARRHDLYQRQQDARRRRHGRQDDDKHLRSRRAEDVRLRFEEEGSRRVGQWPAFAAEVSKSVDTSSAKASLKPNGQTKQIGGKSATGYDIEETMNAAIRRQQGHEHDRDAGRSDLGGQGCARFGRLRPVLQSRRREGVHLQRSREPPRRNPVRPAPSPRCTSQMAATGGIPYEDGRADQVGRQRSDGGTDRAHGQHHDDQHGRFGRRRPRSPTISSRRRPATN